MMIGLNALSFACIYLELFDLLINSDMDNDFLVEVREQEKGEGARDSYRRSSSRIRSIYHLAGNSNLILRD